MQRIGSVDSLFHEGNPAIGQKGTKVTALWLNELQEEVIAMQDEVRAIAGDYAVVASDRVLSVDASGGDIDITLLAANNAAARRLIIHREDDTINKINLFVAEGTISRMASFPEALTVQDEVVVFTPKASTNNWLKL